MTQISNSSFSSQSTASVGATSPSAAGERASLVSPGKAPGSSQVKASGVDDGWDSASGTSWATDLVEANEAARKQAWRDHQDHLERSFSPEKYAEDELSGATAQADVDTPDAKSLTGEVAPLKDPIFEAQTKVGYRSLKQSDTALQHSARSTQTLTPAQTAGAVQQPTSASNPSGDGHSQPKSG